MSALRYDVARPQDDAQLRDVLAATPMDGRVQVSFRRDPDFFRASVVEGPFHQTLVARDGELVAGIGCRSVRQRYVNSEPLPIGYLSGLRLRPQYRGSGLLARGYRFLHTLHQDDRTHLYLTTIAEGNETAQRLLTSARTWLPRYHPAGRYCTFLISTFRTPRIRNHIADSLEIRPASESDLPAVLGFLRETGRQRQFFPCYEARDFFNDQGTFRDLRASNILLAFRQQQLLGILGAWDQRGFRQTVVEGYSGLLRPLRIAYNMWARIRKLPQLPAPRQTFPFITAALPVVANDDPAVFWTLLRRLTENLATRPNGPGGVHLLLGLHANDPLTAVAKRFATHVYYTHLYYVCWQDGETLRNRIDRRPPYLELGCL